MKKTRTICLSEELIQLLEEIRINSFNGAMSKSAHIEYWIREGLKYHGKLREASISK